MMLESGTRSVDFSLPDATDQPHRLSAALSDGPVVLAFMKTGCMACNLTFPYLERLSQAFPATKYQVWGISQDPAQAANSFATRNGVTFPLLIDAADLAVSKAYDPAATPTLFLIDQAGVVRSCRVGHSKVDLNELAAELAGLVGAAPVVVAPLDDGRPDTRPG
jgi:peroxiredoxin